jgi:hypothetical protein
LLGGSWKLFIGVFETPGDEMKKFTLIAMLLAVLGIFSFSSPSWAATDVPTSALTYTCLTPTTTGQLGAYLILATSAAASPNDFTIDWTVYGTAPSACTFRVEGSFDGVTWYGLDTTSPASTSCTTSNMESIVYKPVAFLRINIVTWTNGDATTVTAFHFTGTKRF